jgi:DNA modification methylase
MRTMAKKDTYNAALQPFLDVIREEDEALHARLGDNLCVNNDLTRQLVSFQANKKQVAYRWFKYKEGFSVPLVRYILQQVGVSSGTLLDPFAGAGTALFASASLGLDSVGIELLPIGCEVMKVRKQLFHKNSPTLVKTLKAWIDSKPWETEHGRIPFQHLRITHGAFPKATTRLLEQYTSAVEKVGHRLSREVLKFASLCVLENISYTRKDGQYLRWDHRCEERNLRSSFDKGRIVPFSEAILAKLSEILSDIQNPDHTLFDSIDNGGPVGNISIVQGSVLDRLPKMKTNSCDCIITSPPYCNRYDYTRTYALELAMLGVDEESIKTLRQTMLSCTVENRDKENLERGFTRQLYRKSVAASQNQSLLQAILRYLEKCKEEKLLNNTGIARMVKNYFLEMSPVLFECGRILKKNAPLVMVNDNVRYAGVPIPLDLILSDIAMQAGFELDTIWVLPRGKGNSSQQMGVHGREELRKCVYIWRAPGSTD